MPKTGKTSRRVMKRFKLTARGKVRRNHSGKSHLATALSSKRRRNLKGTAILDKTMEGMIKRAMLK